jgi:hypothetical protein
MPSRSDASAVSRPFAEAVGRVVRAARTLETVRPAPLLAVVATTQIAVAFAVALTSTHNSWLFYSGGDATEYWAHEWALGHGYIPQTVVGYGLPVLFAWVPLVAGPALVNGAVVVVLLQALVLVPLALVLVWAVADRIGGRLFAWWAAAAWICAPLLVLRGLRPDYRGTFEELFLVPHWYGFTNMADFPSLVVALAVAWATFRAVDSGFAEDAAVAGAAAAVALALKPANGFLLAAPAIAFALARRRRQSLVWIAALAPAVATLALWKYRGLGYLPATSLGERHLTLGWPEETAAATSYIPLDWDHFADNLAQLREVFWSLRLVEVLAIAGAFALIRRAPLKGIYVLVWMVTFCVVKGSSERTAVATTTYFRLTEPGLAAFFLLAAGAVLLVPTLGRRRPPAKPTAPVLNRRGLGVVFAVVIAVPLLAIAAARPASADVVARDNRTANEMPIHELGLKVSVGERVRLSWRRPGTGGPRVFYIVFRDESGDGCEIPPRGVPECLLTMAVAGTTRATAFADEPGRGRHWYRVAVAANAADDGNAGGDLVLLSPAVRADVR